MCVYNIYISFGFPARLLSFSMPPSKVPGYLAFNRTLASFILLAVAIGGSFGPLAVAYTFSKENYEAKPDRKW